MAATGSWYEYNGAGSTESANIANLNFGTDDSSALTPADYPITAGSNSYEKYIKISFGGTFNYIGSLFFWKSGGNYVTGESCYCSSSGSPWSQINYATPSMTNSSDSGSVHASLPSEMNVGFGGNVLGSITSADKTDYIRLQLRTTSSTPPGDVNQKTFKLQWTEA
jgi:hypothetical protein